MGIIKRILKIIKTCDKATNILYGVDRASVQWFSKELKEMMERYSSFMKTLDVYGVIKKEEE